MDGDRQDNRRGVVVVVIFFDGGLERHARQVCLLGVFLAVVVEVSV